MPDINNIFQELKKRKVFRSLAIYAGVSFILLQVCSIVFPALLLPDWSIRFVVVLLIIGFPTLIIFSWIYDVTPEGIVKTDKGKSSSNINYSTIILILVFAGGLLYYFQDKFFEPKINSKSVAVLPFENFSPNPEDEYLSAGFTEVIIANLAKVQDLMVISRTSVMRYKDKDMNLKEIAEELGVANILEGSIQRTGSKIRIVAQLIEAETDKHLWAETYDKDFDDIFLIQTSIAQEIAGSLKSQISESEKLNIEDKLTDSIEAYELYIRVKESRKTRLSRNQHYKLRKKLLGEIIEIDPGFAEAYALISLEYSEGVHYGRSNPQSKKEKSKMFIDKAFKIKPESPDVRFAYGYYYYGCLKDYLRAIEHYQYALSKEPGNAEYNQYIGFAHRRLGNADETLKYLEKAYILDPNDTGLLHELNGTYLFYKRYDKINLIKTDKVHYRIAPNDGYLYTTRAELTFWFEGNTANARKIIEESTILIPDFDFYESILWKLDIFDENYDNYLDYVINKKDSLSFNQRLILPKQAEMALGYWLLEDDVKQKRASQKALDMMINLQEFQGDPRYHLVLGFIYAMLGNNEDAVKETKMAMALSPSSKDAMLASIFKGGLAEVYTVIGEHDMALNMIEIFLTESSSYNWNLIKYHHIFNKVFKNNPRFKSIVKKDEERFKKEATYDLGIYLP